MSLKKDPIRKKAFKIWLFNQQKGICPYCGRRMDSNFINHDAEKDNVLKDNFPTFEHIVEEASGGKFNRANIILTCFRCNQKKGKVFELAEN